MEQKRSSFSGKLGYVLSAAGASVGLGNIWRFPYLAAKYGGGIFLLVYIILALTFGYTMIIAETGLYTDRPGDTFHRRSRRTGRDPIGDGSLRSGAASARGINPRSGCLCSDPLCIYDGGWLELLWRQLPELSDRRSPSRTAGLSGNLCPDSPACSLFFGAVSVDGCQCLQRSDGGSESHRDFASESSCMS